MSKLQRNCAFELILIDGLTRTGKSALSGVIPAFQGVEHIKFCTVLEHILAGMSTGHVTAEFAKAFFRTFFNELSYDTLLSRNVNFRKNDQTGIYNYKDPALYELRLNRSEDAQIFKDIGSENRFLPMQTHDVLCNMKNWEMVYDRYLMISLWRNPVELLYSWWKRNWGERFFNDDPSNFTLKVSMNGNFIPWYAHNMSSNWTDFNAVERCYILMEYLIEQAVLGYNKSFNKQKIHLVKFETLCSESENEIHRMSRFLNAMPDANMNQMLSNARLPRENTPEQIDRKEKELKEVLSAKLFARLCELQTDYIDNFYGLTLQKGAENVYV